MKVLFGMAAIIATIAGLGYLLYINGFLVVNAKSALLYLGSPRWGKNRNHIKATFSACSGTVKRVVCLEAQKRYRFVFSSNTKKGTVCVLIQGRSKELVARLDNANPCCVMETDKATRYRVTTKFENADGDYTLSWNEVSP